MLRYETGDIWAEPRRRIIVHGVNCRGVMGAGFARQVKDLYPRVFNLYAKLCRESAGDAEGPRQLLGTLQPIQVDKQIYAPELSRWLVNAFTQDQYGREGRYVSYDAVDRAFAAFATWYREEELDTAVAMPKIGAGLGGGEWSIIEAIIDHHLGALVHPGVTVFELPERNRG